METLIKQTRLRFPSRRQENRDDSTGTRDRAIPSQQAQSYRDKRRSQSWIRRQFSRQMSTSSDYDHTAASDYPAAVAAAAYAIQSLEESRARDYKGKTKYRPDRRFNAMSKEHDKIDPPETPRSALRSSGQSSKKSFKDPDMKVPIGTSRPQKAPEKKPSHKKKLSFADADETIPTQQNEPVIETKRPMRRPSTFADKQLNIAEEPKPYRPPTPLPRGQVQPVEATISQRTTRSRPVDSQADAWEKEEMASIRERYEKMKATIDDWENKKKAKAKRKIERTEAKLERRWIKADTSTSNINDWEKKQAELDKKRIKSAQSYRIEVKRIEGIAGGARTQAEENQRREESKIREKANKIRATGKLPPTCLCF